MTASSKNKKKNKPISRASAPKLLQNMGKHPNVPMSIEFERDSSSITSLRPPAPLPPTPADGDHDGWFEQMPTNPSQIPDLGAMTSMDTESLPTWARSNRLPSVSGEVSMPRTRTRAHTDPGDMTYATPKVRVGSHSYVLLLLVAAACLAVGMVLGALLQNKLDTDACPDPAAHTQAK